MIDDDDLGATVFRDMTMLALAGMVTIVMLLLPWLNPPGTNDEAVADPSGSVIVEAFWPDGVDADVDLWVQAPNDGPVGFSSMAGLYFNLLRDDLGERRDATPINYEIAYTRGISPGEHIANVHLYRGASAQGAIPVTVAVSAVRPGHRARNQLFRKDYVLNVEGQEITAARFAIDSGGKLVPGSVHTLARSLLGPGNRAAYRQPQPESGQDE